MIHRLHQVSRWGGVALTVLVLASTGVLALARLDNTLFWDDEALVAINARNFLTTGRLTAWDGRNLYAFRNGTLLDENLRTRDTELHFLLTAFAFKVLGVSTWAGRFPSVAVGLGTLVLLTIFLRRHWQLPWPWVLYGVASLALSVVFLLGIRQCRYYALTMFCGLAVWWVYWRAIRGRRYLDFLWLSVAATLLFYAHLLTGTAFLLATGLMYFLYHRHLFRGKELFKPMLWVALFLPATLPYVVANRVWDRPEHEALVGSGMSEPAWWNRWLILVWWNLRDLGFYGGLPWLLAVGIIGLLFYLRREGDVRQFVGPVAVTVAGFVVALSWLSPQPTRQTVIADVRYLLPILPLISMLIGWLLWRVHRWSRALAVGVLGVHLVCNVFSLAPGNTQFRWLLPAYIHEITHPFPTSYRAASDFLEVHAKQDDRVLAFPDFCNYPLMFYQGHRVIFCCLLNQQTRLPREKIEQLKAPLFLEEHFPDWFIAFGATPEAARLLAYFSRPHVANSVTNQHQYVLVTNLHVFWFDTSRPELPWHTFGPKTDFNPATESVYVFRRIPSP